MWAARPARPCSQSPRAPPWPRPLPPSSASPPSRTPPSSCWSRSINPRTTRWAASSPRRSSAGSRPDPQLPKHPARPPARPDAVGRLSDPVFSVDDVRHAFGAELIGEHAGAADAFAGVTNDSRVARPGELFVALETEKRDGHDLIAHALPPPP